MRRAYFQAPLCKFRLRENGKMGKHELWCLKRSRELYVLIAGIQKQE